MKYLFTIFLFCATILSCSTTNDFHNGRKTYLVASKKADCIGVIPQKCMLVKKGSQKNWEFFYDSIKGFNYQEGYEYIIEVSEKKNENPLQDASSIEYTLVKVISKTEKTSENIPN